ncbi:MAG: transposase [Saprospiraceae bacterium]|nr:transposase [Saprospiraceae bacterium]
MRNILKNKYSNPAIYSKDESSIKVMDGKRKASHTGYMWVMAPPNSSMCCFEYHKGRGREGPENNYKQSKGFYKQGCV